MTTFRNAADYAAGYQQALRDIRTARDQGGWELVQDWLQDNLRPSEEDDNASHHGSAVDYSDTGDVTADRETEDPEYLRWLAEDTWEDRTRRSNR